jgi:hypothetical protein
MVARFPSVLFGTASILAIFFLVYRSIQTDLHGDPIVPATFAALLTGISIVQIEFSQRVMPYGAVTFLSTVLIILHLAIVRVIQKNRLSIDKFVILAFLYALISGFALFIHLSFTVVLAGSFLILGIHLRQLWDLDRQSKVTVLGITAFALLAVFLAWIGNAIHVQSPYRAYLAPYYHQLDLGALSFLVTRAYDLATYHLNLFYNGALYWPRQLNPLLLPLVVICVIGWCHGIVGKYGRTAQDLSLLAIICVALAAIFSLFKKYPFGGIRQTLFIAPFLFSLTAMGFYTLTQSRIGKLIGVILAGSYMLLWAINLPLFYQERSTPFSQQELLTVWKQTGKLKFYSFSACEHSIKYRLQQHSEIGIKKLRRQLPEAPFLLISTHWPLEDPLWRTTLQEELKESGGFPTLVMMRAPKYPLDRLHQYHQSLYWPPNGLWIYKVTAQEDQ